MATKITVYHSEYGCETGCCGHVIKIETDGQPDPKGRKADFNFFHPYGEDPKTWAQNWVREEFGEEHVKDLDWEHSFVSND